MRRGFKSELEVEHEGQRYKLRMDLNTFADFEDETGQAALEWAEAMEAGKVRMRDMITMMLCALMRHHGEATRQLAGDILSDDPEILQRLILATSPKPSEIEDRAPGK